MNLPNRLQRRRDPPGFVSALAFATLAMGLAWITSKAIGAQQRQRARRRGPVRDYSARSGFPMGVEAVRGLAARDFKAPDDMRPPEPMRPGMVH